MAGTTKAEPFKRTSGIDREINKQVRQTKDRQRERERERSGSHFGSSIAPLLGGLCRLLASGGRRGVALRLCPRGSSRRLSQRCLSKHIRCHFASGNPTGVASHSRDGHVRRTTAVRGTWCLQELDLRPCGPNLFSNRLDPTEGELRGNCDNVGQGSIPAQGS